MSYSTDEILQYIKEEDVKFIRLAFCDVYGKQKNVSVMPGEIARAFSDGIAFDGSAIEGFGTDVRSDLFLVPDPATISVLPWRPEHGKVVRVYCSILKPDKTPFEQDTRNILKSAIADAEKAGLKFAFGSEMEFYLFKCDESGKPTREPYDEAGYMDIAPEDKGENVRREICLTLDAMGIKPESSHHEEGAGQNEIDFRYSDPLSAADNAVTFKTVVRTIAARNGLFADFSPKPLPAAPGNGMHVNMSVKSTDGEDVTPYAIAGIMNRIAEITAFLNPVDNSYERLGNRKAPRFISWSAQNRSQLIRVPAAEGEYKRIELRSPDPCCNPYVAFALLIRAATEGIEQKLTLPPACDLNLFACTDDKVKGLEKLPADAAKARGIAAKSEFVKSVLPAEIIKAYCISR